MARASGGANNMHPLSWGWGGTNRKDPKFKFVNLLNGFTAFGMEQMTHFSVKYGKEK